MIWERGIPVLLSGAFYTVLCVFSIVTGLMYLRKNNTVNPLELPKAMAKRIDDPLYMRKVSVFFGWLTFFVGLVQGMTAYSLLLGSSPWCYWLALGFTVFSMLSAGSKLIMTFNLFPIMKEAAYIAVFVVLMLSGTRGLYF